MIKYLNFILKVLLIPFTLLYMISISLFVMPLIIAKRYWGYPIYVFVWGVYFIGIWFTFVPYIKDYWGILNNIACWGISGEWRTTSSYIGHIIDSNEASWIELFHCKLLANWDKSGSHCSKSCKGFLNG
jgi:hypothetical protein